MNLKTFNSLDFTSKVFYLKYHSELVGVNQNGDLITGLYYSNGFFISTLTKGDRFISIYGMECLNT